MIEHKKIFLFGYGNFGRQLYKNLSLLGHEIVIASFNDDHIENAKEDNVNIIKINIKRNDDIYSLNIDQERDMIYCSMSKTANNLFLVLTLRALLPKANIIAISNSFENTRKLEYAGANSVIDLYEATSRRVINILTKPAVTKALDEIIYKHNNIKMAEIVIPKNSFLQGSLIKDIPFKKMGVIVVAIIDKEMERELLLTDHRINHRLDEGDTLVIVATRDDLNNFKDFVYKEEYSSLSL
jgi:voltage-gated potassium channel